MLLPLTVMWRAFLVALIGVVLTPIAVAQSLFLDYPGEASSAEVIDYSGHSHNAAILSTLPTPSVISLTGGPTGKYLAFDGVNGRLRAPTFTSPTFAVATKLRLHEGRKSAYQYIVSNHKDYYGAAETVRGGFGIRVNTDYAIWAEVDLVDAQGHPYVLRATTTNLLTLAFERWYDLLVTFDGKSLKIFVDNRQITSVYSEPATIPAPVYDSLTIADNGGAPNTRNLNGDLDNLKIWGDIQDSNQTISLTKLQSESLGTFSFNSAPVQQGNDPWFFNESGKETDLQATGTTWEPNAGVSGGAIRLGNNSNLTLHTLGVLSSQHFTYGSWIKLDASTSSATSTKPQAIVSNSGQSVCAQGGFRLSVQNDGMVGADFCVDTKPRSIIAPVPLRAGFWYHVALVVDGSSATLFVNGVEQAQFAYDEQPLPSPTADISIGHDTAGSTVADPLHGWLDEVYLSNEALSGDEIWQLVVPHGLPHIGSVFNFDSTNGDDAGLLKANLTLQPQASIGTGVSGAGLALNGSELSYAKAENTARTEIYSGALTVAVWFSVSALGSNQIIVSNADDTTQSVGGFSLRVYANGHIAGQFSLSSSQSTSTVLSTTTVQPGRWYHSAVTFDGSTAKLFIDGALEASAAIDADTMAPPPYDLHVGTSASDPGTGSFVGTIDDLYVLGTAMSDGEIKRLAAPYRLFSVNPIRDTWVLPDYLPWDLKPLTDQGLYLSAAPGEYEAVSMVVKAVSNLTSVTGLTLTASDFISANASISNNSVDIRLVKAWYQDNGDVVNHSSNHLPILKPELLLHDDGFVTVDNNTRQNSVRDPQWPNDSATLLSMALPAGKVQQYFVTFHIPSDAPAGTYAGTLYVHSSEFAEQTIPIQIVVRAFTLAQPSINYSIFYKGQIDDTTSAVSHDVKTTTQYSNEMRDLLAHGVDRPGMTTLATTTSNVTSPSNFQRIDYEMNLRKLAGLPGRSRGGAIPFLGLTYFHNFYYSYYYDTSSSTRELILTNYNLRLNDTVAHFADPNRDYPEPLFVGIDESTGDKIVAQVPLFDAIQSHSARSALVTESSYFGTLEAVRTGGGALVNVPIVNAGVGDYALAEAPLNALEDPRHELWAYAIPQVGIERSYLYRINAGLGAWVNGFNGIVDYAYQHFFGDPWNDLDGDFRDHVFAYPTATGVVDTVEWEGFREGVDDVKYLTSLRTRIASAAATNNAGLNELAAREQGFVDRLEAAVQAVRINENRLPAIREILARKITRLDGALVDWSLDESTGSILRPPNDNFANAYQLAGLSGHVFGSNVYASIEINEPTNGTNVGGKSEWWEWTAPQSGTVSLDTYGSTFDTLLSVYTGATLANLVVIATNDDSGYGILQSAVKFDAVAGTVYHIIIDGFNAGTGAASGTLASNYTLAPAFEDQEIPFLPPWAMMLAIAGLLAAQWRATRVGAVGRSFTGAQLD